ncbi:MAG: hydantoinase B/oxoprolinase family protein [Phycisphaerales bacterium]
MSEPWRMWIDTGGTFTDCLAVDPSGRTHRAKVLSVGGLRGRIVGTGGRGDILFVEQDWGAPARFIDGFRLRVHGSAAGVEPRVVGFDPEGGAIRIDLPLGFSPLAGSVFEARGEEEAPILAARLVTRTPPGAPLPPIEMRLGTTRGTNALLERTGAPVAFFVTRGFADLLEIGTQQRPDLFALRIVKPSPIHRHVVEVPERLAADGSVRLPLDPAAIEGRVRALVRDGVRTAAIALMHAWINPEHERVLETYLRVAGFVHVSSSASLSPTIKLLPRAQTAVVDAYLAPVIDGYLARVAAALSTGAPPAGARLRVMTSAGGLASAGAFRPTDSLLSGPAGGVAGAAGAAAASGLCRVIAFDMGGTSTDVARIEDATTGEYEYQFEHEVGDARIAAPALAIESVAAGGGSICGFDGDGLTVGPASAGADPGPACYGAGGPLTITDVNLLLGRLDPSRFGVPIDAAPARARFDELLRRVRERGGPPADADTTLVGLLDIACDRMGGAIRRISVQRGFDPEAYALVAFGGAGPQHACRVADTLGIRTILVPADAGLLCCLGLGHAPVERFAERQVLRPLSAVERDLAALVDELGASALRALAEEGVPGDRARVRRRLVHLRFAGQESTLAAEFPPRSGVGLRAAFEARYRDTYGHVPSDREVEVESVRVVASSQRERAASAPVPGGVARAEPTGRRRVWFDDAWTEAPVFDRARLVRGAAFDGPGLVVEPFSVTVVEPDWSCRVDGAGALMLERAGPIGGAPSIREELATARLASIAGDMGEMLRRTALSVNIKERLDFSCALLDARGQLIVNAPHIPVHLGAIGVCVRALAARVAMRPGDVLAVNHPAFGGSHLPDVTVVTPIFDDAGGLLAYAANRAHHAEIGGIRPGSMPFDARSLAEEGVVIPPMHLVREGDGRWDGVRALLGSGPFPSRAVGDNLADLAAQVAANRRGAAAVGAFGREHGGAALRDAMDAVTARAARRMREAIARLGGVASAPRTAEDALDDGTPIRVRIELDDDSIVRVDFTGTGGVHPGCLNATPAIVRSAVMYVLRLLIDEPVPLNEGLLDGVEIIVPHGLLNPGFPEDPTRCPPVAAGNTETSQRLVDVLLRAFGACAGSQGTMNNVAFGNARFGYYETVCGGAGAGPGFDGAHAVHTHMTNTRITDPEVLERRYPVRLDRFAVRRGSGGAGRHRGGDGVEREITFLEPGSLSILSQHRGAGPRGLAGGAYGLPGRQHVVRADGMVLELGAIGGCEVGPGDRFVLHTPGGGGFGAVESGRAGGRNET